MNKLIIGLSALLLMPWTVSAQENDQEWQPPRTEFGQPDLQGLWYFGSATPMERPDSLGDKQIYTDEEVAEMEAQLQQRDEMRFQPLDGDRPAPEEGAVIGIEAEFDYMISNTELVPVKGAYRTSLIIDPPDGKMPLRDPYEDYYTRLYESGVARYDHAEAMGASERCLVYALAVPSMFPMPWNPHLQIVQTRDYVVLHTEMIHDARIIRLNSEPNPDGFNTWMGDSIGHWEGDTLVVTTINFRPEQSSSMLVMSEEFELTEWFTPISDDEIIYRYRVKDPKSYTRPFTVERVISRVAPDVQMYEFACHEGNYSLEYSLVGARHDEINAQRNLNLDKVVNAHLPPALIQAMEGIWSGKVNSFMLHFRFLPGNNGGMHALLDYPAGGMTGLEVTNFKTEAGTIDFQVPAIAASFSGTLEDGVISGGWTRSGSTSPLQLTHQGQ